MQVNPWHIGLILVLCTLTSGETDIGDFIHLRVAVIGAGPGGTSAAYFLRKQLGSEADIEVFERNAIPGGRVNSRIISGQSAELGGAVYHRDNKLFADLVREGNFKTFNPVNEHPDPDIDPPESFEAKNHRLGVWNGKEFTYQTTEYSALNIINGLWRYGLDGKYTDAEAEKTLHKFLKIYELLEETEFSTVDELLDAIDLNSLTKISLEDYLFSNGFCGYNGGKFCHEIVTGLTRVNYGQSMKLNALVGLIALIGSTDDIFGVVGGNYKVLEYALSAANAQVRYNSPVSAIIKEEGSDKYSIEYTDSKTGNKVLAEGFDKVVIAAPLEFADIVCKGFELPKEGMQKRAYQLTHVAMVVGNLNLPGYFGVQGTEPQDIITTEDPEVEFSSIFLHTEYNAEGELRNLYKVFSRERLSEEKLHELFTDIQTIFQTEFYAYPVLDPLPEDVPFPPIILDKRKNLFYVNALESPFSTIETEMISGKNIANLISSSLK